MHVCWTPHLKKYFQHTTLFLLLLPCAATAQEKIESDRPTETQSAQTVTRKMFQLESGVVYRRLESGGYSFQHPEVLVRYGVFKNLELRARATAETQKLKSENINRYGLEPVEVGVKWEIAQKPQQYAVALLGHVGIPKLSSTDHDPHKTYVRWRALAEHNVGEKLKLEYNAGMDWSSEDQEQNWIAAFSPLYELSDKWLLYGEVYSFFQKQALPQHQARVGLEYFISANVELDLNAGAGLNKAAPRYFWNAGFGFRL